MEERSSNEKACSEEARERARLPDGSQAILNARTLGADHRRLAGLLTPGMAVLDVGCGTGALTRGAAERVGPTGRAVGLDIDASLIGEARLLHGAVPNLRFLVADAAAGLPPGFEQAFDVVTAARTLQWLTAPAARAALGSLVRAARPRTGRVLVLDYNHVRAAWEPGLPASGRRFYEAFLAWRADAGMDNAIADSLPRMFAEQGLRGVAVTEQHETARRGEPALGLWAKVADTRGRQMVAAGYLSEEERREAAADLRRWASEGDPAQTLYLLAVEGVRP